MEKVGKSRTCPSLLQQEFFQFCWAHIDTNIEYYLESSSPKTIPTRTSTGPRASGGPSWGDIPLPPTGGEWGGRSPPSEPLESVSLPPPSRGCPALGGIVVALREPRGVRPTPTVARPPRGGCPDGTPILGGRGVVLLASLVSFTSKFANILGLVCW